MQGRKVSSLRDVIVHPQFRHMLHEQAPEKPDWNTLPLEVLHVVAQHLEARDLCNMGRVNRACRCIPLRPLRPPSPTSRVVLC